MKRSKTAFFWKIPGLLVLIGGILGCGYTHDSASRVYVDPQFHFAVAIPHGWTLSSATGSPQILFVMYPENLHTPYPVSVTLTAEPLPRMMSPASYAAMNVRLLQRLGTEILNQREEYTPHLLFLLLIWRMREENRLLRVQSYLFVKDKLGFAITCTAPESIFPQFEPEFARIVSSLRF